MAVILSAADNILTTESGGNKTASTFALPSYLCDAAYNRLTYNNRIVVLPRYTDNSTAASKTFTSAGDYADPTNHNSSGVGWSYDFKVGDSVEVVNGVPLMGLEEGMRGRVVLLTNDGNIGVKFRRHLEKGTDLGGKCADGHGLVCLAMDLKRK